MDTADTMLVAALLAEFTIATVAIEFHAGMGSGWSRFVGGQGPGQGQCPWLLWWQRYDQALTPCTPVFGGQHLAHETLRIDARVDS